MSKDKGLPLIQRTKTEQKQPLSFPYWVLVFSATKKTTERSRAKNSSYWNKVKSDLKGEEVLP